MYFYSQCLRLWKDLGWKWPWFDTNVPAFHVQIVFNSHSNKPVNMIITCKKVREGLPKTGHLQPRFYSKARALSTQLCVKWPLPRKSEQTNERTIQTNKQQKKRKKRSLTSKNELNRRPGYLVRHSAQSSLKFFTENAGDFWAMKWFTVIYQSLTNNWNNAQFLFCIILCN